jgi:hypothetical protein
VPGGGQPRGGGQAAVTRADDRHPSHAATVTSREEGIRPEFSPGRVKIVCRSSGSG